MDLEWQSQCPGLPYTTLSYGNGFGYADLGEETDAEERSGHESDAGRQDLSRMDH